MLWINSHLTIVTLLAAGDCYRFAKEHRNQINPELLFIFFTINNNINAIDCTNLNEFNDQKKAKD